MIIELFGPECSGKTTFARALSTRLQEHDYPAEIALSCRPAETLRPCESEKETATDSRHSSFSRLFRSATEALSIARRPIANSSDLRTALGLVRTLPPRNPLWAIKQAQYIARLSHVWRELSRKSPIVLFDQAFIQVVCALLLLGGMPEDAVVASAIEHVPRADLLIRLVAPLELLEARLRARKSRQSGFEQLFEFNLPTSLTSFLIADRLHRLLVERGRTVLCVSSTDQRSIEEGVDAIEALLMRNLRTKQRGAA